MRKGCFPAYAISLLMVSAAQAANGFDIGAGLLYNPTARLEYAGNPEADYEIIDNVIWVPRMLYDFGNGFRAGAHFDIYKKRIFPGGSTRSDVSFWGAGLLGEYDYAITESGRTLVVGGMETGYERLTDRSNSMSARVASIGVAAYGGVRYMFSPRFSLEMDYHFGWLEFDLNASPKRKYNYSGSGLRLSIAYQFYVQPGKTEE
jgi:hypothetical protein